MRLLTPLTLASCLLIGCASGPPPTPASPPVKVPPPANTTRAPQPLPQPASGRMRDLESNHTAVAKAYHLLAAQMCDLLAFLEVHHDECRQWRRGDPANGL